MWRPNIACVLGLPLFLACSILGSNIVRASDILVDRARLESVAPDAAPTTEAGPPVETRPDAPERESGRNGNEAEDTVETDRDAFTPQTQTVAPGLFILESAYSYINNRDTLPTHSVPEMLLRYGVAPRIELRLGWNFETGGASNDISGQEAEDVFQARKTHQDEILSYGIKAMLTDQKRFLPESAFIVQGLTPTGGDSTATQVVATYVFGWKLPNRWKVDSAIRFGTESENGERFEQWSPSSVLRIPITERWAAHTEYFGLFSQDRAPSFCKHYFSTGMHYLLSRNLEVGFRVGWGLNDQSTRFFSNVGFGWRF
jgi:hypothetical protein